MTAHQRNKKAPRLSADQKSIHDACVRLWQDKASEFYTKDGRQRRGSNIRCAFWNAFDGARTLPLISGSLLVGAKAAGLHCAGLAKAAASADQDPRPSPSDLPE